MPGLLPARRAGRQHRPARAARTVAAVRAARRSRPGTTSVHAFPLRLRDQVIGALNLFGTDDRTARAGRRSQIVQALADVATIGLLQQRAIAHGEVLTEQLQGALNSRITIEQAKGAFAQRTASASTRPSAGSVRRRARAAGS